MNKIEISTLLKAGLIATVCAFAAVQWTVGRHLLTSSVFDHRRGALLYSFGQFRTALQSEVLRQCASGPIQRIYFDDLAVGLPYIVNATANNPSCQVVRTTPVTPVAIDDRVSCSAVIILEKHLSWWLPGTMEADLGDAASRVVRVKTWSADDGNYGFDVFRRRGCGTAEDLRQ